MSRPRQNAVLDTALTTAQVAEIFRAAMKKGLLGLLQEGTQLRTLTSTPFDTLDDDPPDFSVLADVPTFRSRSSVIHLYVWDRGTRRKIQIVAFGGFFALRVHIGYKVNRFVSRLQLADPAARVTSGAT